MKSKPILLITLGVLLIFTIVVFALTIAVFVQLQNNKSGRQVAPAGQPQPAGTTTAAPGSTATGSSAPGSTTGGPTQQPTSGAPPPPTTAGPTLNWYSSQLTDEKQPWNDQFSNPVGSEFAQLKAQYETNIETALNKANPPIYANAKPIVSGFSRQLFTDNNLITRVQFTVGVPTERSPFQLRTDLQYGADQSTYTWRNIDTGTPELPPPLEADTTPGWTRAAQMFLSNINISVDPCQDFYRFSCDNYIANHPLGNASSQSTFGVLQDIVTKNLTDSFESFTGTTPRTKKVVKDIYTACKNASIDNYKGAQVVMDITNEYGGWPLLDPEHWNPSKIRNDIYWMIGDIFTTHGVATLMVPMVDINTKNVDGKNILSLDQANLLIPKEYYRSPNLTERYQKQMIEIISKTALTLAAQNHSIKIDNDTIKEQATRIMHVEYHLAMISVPSDQRRNMSKEYNPYNITQAQAEFPALDWNSFFDGLLKSIFPNPSDVLNPFIIDLPDQYNQELNSYMDQVNKNDTMKMDLVNYLIFRAINPYMQFAGPDLSKIVYDFRRSVRIDPMIRPIDPVYDDPTDRESNCVNFLASSLPWATGRMYVDHSFEAPNRDDVSVMINNVLSAFSSGLSGLQWMDNVSALKAFLKVQGLIRNVAYPDFEQDDDKLDKYHAQFNDAAEKINMKGPYALIEYVRAIVWFGSQTNFGQLTQNGSRIEFLMSPAIVNAWYQPERNSITFPAAILNEPFYRYDFPQAVNYGGLGVVMGHELSHGFDDQGIQFDFDGTLRTWMSPHAEDGFTKMANCVVDEYGRFCYPDLPVPVCINGIRTQGENIGDNGGLKAAYRAYKAYTNSHGEEKPLPGMESYTLDQIFFLSYGQIWCGSYSDEALTKQLLTNEHSPGKDRVIGAVQNFPKFAEAFNCQKGDPMYPVKACDVW